MCVLGDWNRPRRPASLWKVSFRGSRQLRISLKVTSALLGQGLREQQEGRRPSEQPSLWGSTGRPAGEGGNVGESVRVGSQGGVLLGITSLLVPCLAF